MMTTMMSVVIVTHQYQYWRASVNTGSNVSYIPMSIQSLNQRPDSEDSQAPSPEQLVQCKTGSAAQKPH